MQDIRLALMTGADIPIEECQLIIHQPKLKEIALIGETSCFSAVQCLSIDKKNLIKDESLLQETSNFQIFMKAVFDERMKDRKKDVEKLFSFAKKTVDDISGGKEKISEVYSSFGEKDISSVEKEEKTLYEKLKDSIDDDIRLKFTSEGSHRDDFTVYINGETAKI